MPAPSLLKLATAACARNVKRIDDVGNTPYFLIHPVLMRVENPEHLHQIERKSPHLVEDTTELWLEFIKRDVPRTFKSSKININFNINSNSDDDGDNDNNTEQQFTPSSTSTSTSTHKPCYAIYKALVDESQRQFEDDAQKMFRALQETAKKKELSKTKLIDVTPPTRQRNRGGGGGGGGGGASSRPSIKSTIARCAARDRRMMMTGIVDPKKQQSPFQSSGLPSRQMMSTPTHLLNKGLGTVSQAPKGLVEAYKPVTTQQSASAAASPATAGAVGARRTVVPGGGGGVSHPSSSTQQQRRTVASTSSSSSSSPPRRTLRPNPTPQTTSTPPKTTLRGYPIIRAPTNPAATASSYSKRPPSRLAAIAANSIQPASPRSAATPASASALAPASTSAAPSPAVRRTTTTTTTREPTKRQIAEVISPTTSPPPPAAAKKRALANRPQMNVPSVSAPGPFGRIIPAPRRALDNRKRDERAEQQEQQQQQQRRRRQRQQERQSSSRQTRTKKTKV